MQELLRNPVELALTEKLGDGRPVEDLKVNIVQFSGLRLQGMSSAYRKVGLAVVHDVVYRRSPGHNVADVRHNLLIEILSLESTGEGQTIPLRDAEVGAERLNLHYLIGPKGLEVAPLIATRTDGTRCWEDIAAHGLAS
jgi:hypothetical protein